MPRRPKAQPTKRGSIMYFMDRRGNILQDRIRLGKKPSVIRYSRDLMARTEYPVTIRRK